MQNLIGIGILSKPSFTITEHSHTVWEMVYYTHGTGILKIGETEILFEPGIFVCQPPGILHSETSSVGFQNIHFSIGFFKELNSSIPCFKDNASQDIANILTQIYREFHMKGKNWRNIAEALLETLNQYMISWSNLKDKNPFVERFENLILWNISNQRFVIKKAVQEIPLSMNHFRQLFKKETGKTPLEYLIHKRIDYARNLLEAQYYNYTIKEVAARAGFTDPYYFSRVFKKITGKNPSEKVLEGKKRE